MTPKILVTGFEPFGGRNVNPSQQIVDSLPSLPMPGIDLHTALLPVEYDACVEVALTHVERIRPDAVIACGLAAGRTAVTPERIAVNVKDAGTHDEVADNAGRRPREQAISDGPDGLFSTLPVSAIHRALVSAGIPSAVSNTAGTFICNNTMYGLLDHLRRQGSHTLAGFIHVPASTEMAVADPLLPSLPLPMMERALRIAVETVADHLRR